MDRIAINKCTTPSILVRPWPTSVSGTVAGRSETSEDGARCLFVALRGSATRPDWPRARLTQVPSPLCCLHCVVQGTVRAVAWDPCGAAAQHPTDTPLPGARHKKTAQSSSYWGAWSRSSRQQSPRRISWHLSSAIRFPLSRHLSPIYFHLLSFESRCFLSRSYCNTTKMVHQHLRAAGQHIYRRFADEPEKFTLPKWAPAVILADAVLFLPLFLVVRNPHATNSPTPLTPVPRSSTPSAPSSRPSPSSKTPTRPPTSPSPSTKAPPTKAPSPPASPSPPPSAPPAVFSPPSPAGAPTSAASSSRPSSPSPAPPSAASSKPPSPGSPSGTSSRPSP